MRAGPSPSKSIATPRRRGCGVAWLAAVTMTVLAVSPLLAIVHQISARHAVCEHGELVESDHAAIAGQAAGSFGAEMTRSDAESAPASGVRPDSEGVRHGHSHCSVGTLAKNSVSLLPATQVVTVLAEAAASGAPHCEFPHVRTVLLAAPKTSPPPLAA